MTSFPVLWAAPAGCREHRGALAASALRSTAWRGEAGGESQCVLVEDLDLPIPESQQLSGLKVFEDPIDAGAATADEFSQGALTEGNNTVLVLVNENGGELGFEVAGQELH